MNDILSSAQTSALITDRIYGIIKREIQPGQTELSIAQHIKKLIKRFGGEKEAFRIIVASGKRSAKIHGFASSKIIQAGDLVMMDFGVVFHGMCSDITRTFVVGKKPTKKQKEIFKIVKKAQEIALKEVRPGACCCTVDAAAREFIASRGFGKNFPHSTGHGVGKKIHQPPKISAKNYRQLKEGDIITIEPGIYIKGWGGIRIEDLILVTKDGHKRLTRCKISLN